MTTAPADRRPETVLLALAHRFSAREPEMPSGWTYRRDIGAWVDAAAPDELMVSQPPRPPQPAPPERPRPQSKKFDVETGEDMKGA